jgi:hypothetical protein
MALMHSTSIPDRGMVSTLSDKDDPRRVLRRAAGWLWSVGGIIALAGLIGLIRSLSEPTPERFWPVVRAIGAVGGWLIPGSLMILFGSSIPRRKRWAITGAEVTSYIQMFFAGALIVFSLLHVKVFWPMLLISIAWIIPLLFTPKFTGPCSRAMDLIAQMVTLGVEQRRRGR